MSSLERYLDHLKRWWWLVVATALAVAVVSYGVASTQTDSYSATTILLVSPNRVPGTVVLDDVLISERLTSTYEELIVTRPVLEKAAADLKGKETADNLNVSASAVPNTQLIRLSADSSDPDRAALIADTVAAVFIAQNNSDQSSARLGNVSIVEAAEPPESAKGPSVSVRTLAGLLAGVSLALVVVAGRAYFDGSIWNPEDIKATGSQLPCLGVLPLGAVDGFKPPPGGRLVPQVTEPYQALAATVLSALARRKDTAAVCQTLAVVSPRGGEGRTSIVARLGVAIAEDGHRVALVDFDRSHPSLHDEFGLPNKGGVAEALAASRISNQNSGHGTTAVADGLRIMPTGGTGIAPAALHSREARITLDWVKAEEPDFIFIDTPPLQDGSDAVVLAQSVDSAIVVAEARRTTAQAVASAAAQLDAMGVDVLGFVINKR